MRDDLRSERIKKLNKLYKAGQDPYPAQSRRTHTTLEATEAFSKLVRAKKTISLVGRLTGLRDQGAVMFIDVCDESGCFQLLLHKKKTTRFAEIKETLDIGDFIEARGTLFKTKKGQKSMQVKTLRHLSKSLLPAPSQWHGLHNTEIRLRKRYLDLLHDNELKELFRKKARFWQSIRAYLVENNFLEVETPVFELVPGGAEAEPFKTHHNALDQDFYLRISLELPLKKLMVAGYEKVFEIGRIFRNEGIDAEHLQDYTQMEYYWAYQDYEGSMKFLEKLLKKAIKETTGGLTTSWQDKKINWGGKWQRLDYNKLFEKETKLDPRTASKKELIELAKKLKIEKINDRLGKGRLIDLIYKKTVRPKLIQPAFLIDPPIDIEPLAKKKRGDEKSVERFQVVACATELGKGFTELNDPLDQRERFEDQMKLRKAGDTEAQRIDEDYLEAMEYGMPPNSGFGMSERFFAILMDKPVRETVIFPLLRKK